MAMIERVPLLDSRLHKLERMFKAPQSSELQFSAKNATPKHSILQGLTHVLLRPACALNPFELNGTVPIPPVRNISERSGGTIIHVDVWVTWC